MVSPTLINANASEHPVYRLDWRSTSICRLT